MVNGVTTLYLIIQTLLWTFSVGWFYTYKPFEVWLELGQLEVNYLIAYLIISTVVHMSIYKLMYYSMIELSEMISIFIFGIAISWIVLILFGAYFIHQATNTLALSWMLSLEGFMPYILLSGGWAYISSFFGTTRHRPGIPANVVVCNYICGEGYSIDFNLGITLRLCKRI
jgi:hypothetical protein